jgi:hypothetical protein
MHGDGRQTRFSKSAWRIGPLIDACVVGMWRRPPQVNKPKGASDAWGCLCVDALSHAAFNGGIGVEPNMLNLRHLRPAQPLQLSSHLSTQLSTLDTLSEDGCQGR